VSSKVHKINPKDRAQLDRTPVSFSRVAALFRPYRGKLIIVSLIIVASSVISLAQPLLLRLIIDDALPHGRTSLLELAVAGMIAVSIVTGVLGVLQAWLSTSIGQQVMHRLRADVFRKLQSQSMDFFKKTRGGEVQSRITSDITGMQSVITSTATTIAANVTTVIATAIAMAALSWRLSLLSMVILPPAILMTRRVAMIRQSVTRQRQEAMSDLLSQVEESLTVSGAQLIKVLGIADARQNEFESSSATLSDLELKSKLAGKWRTAVMNVTFASVPALIYLAAGFEATSTGLTLGTLIAFATLQVNVFKPTLGLLNIGAEWIASLALLSRIFDYLDLPVDVPPPRHGIRVPDDHLLGPVRFEHVSYRYPDADRDILSDIDITVAPGSSIAIVGETGSGKSTLATLLVRLADPTQGTVRIGGFDVRDLDPRSLTSIVGVVSQDPYLSHTTIRQNLLQARPDATEEMIWNVLAAAQVAETVKRLPDGLNTVVGARGHRFSGGERQRLVIARTLLRDPKILILDEATSALDNATEKDVQVALDRLVVGRTTITIAHRLSTVRQADRIYVLSGGRVTEAGSHTDLLSLGGIYAALASASHVSDSDGGAQAPSPTSSAPSNSPDLTDLRDAESDQLSLSAT
jgi:ATP-binding cassette subfamily B protein